MSPIEFIIFMMFLASLPVQIIFISKDDPRDVFEDDYLVSGGSDGWINSQKEVA